MSNKENCAKELIEETPLAKGTSSHLIITQIS